MVTESVAGSVVEVPHTACFGLLPAPGMQLRAWSRLYAPARAGSPREHPAQESVLSFGSESLFLFALLLPSDTSLKNKTS